jgi:hypothetical protein
VHLDDLDEAIAKTVERRNDFPDDIIINISEAKPTVTKSFRTR